MAEEDCANKVLILSVILISRKSVAFPMWIFVSVLPSQLFSDFTCVFLFITKVFYFDLLKRGSERLVLWG
jgi:hypothetical protein